MDTVAAEAATVVAVAAVVAVVAAAAEATDHVALAALAVHSIVNHSPRSTRPAPIFVWELGAVTLEEAFTPVHSEPAFAPRSSNGAIQTMKLITEWRTTR